MPKGIFIRSSTHILNNSISHKGKHYSKITEFKKGNIPWNKGKKGLQTSYNKGKHLSEETKEKISKKRLGKKLSKETIEKIRIANTGKKRSIESKLKYSLALKGLKKSLEHVKNMSLSRKNKPNYSCRGSKSYFWKGGITKTNRIIRNSIEYRLWRESVFKRDNWTCVWCGIRGGRLEADHIKPFSLFPELRFAIDNGRTLCKECHKKTDTYLNKMLKYK